MAAALLDGRVTIETFTDKRRFAPDIEALLGKTEVKMNPRIPANFDEMRTTVTVTLKNSQQHSVTCQRPRGIWGNPLTREERLVKFRNCASRLLSPAEVERCIEFVESLERQRDIAPLVEMMARHP